MSKLLKLKEWLTVPDAARHLSILFDEEVGEADVLRLALDGRLKLSVFFVNGAYACCGKVVTSDEDDRVLTDSTYGNRPGLVSLILDMTFQPAEKIEPIEGVWDLMMLGAESHYVEREWQKLTGGARVEVRTSTGVFLSQEDASACILHEYIGDGEPNWLLDPPSEYKPAVTLPQDARLVIRTAALQALEESLSEVEELLKKPLGNRERTTLLVIIAALVEIAKIDRRKPSKAASLVARQTELLGARVSERTILDHLNRVPDALERRGSDDAVD